MSTRLVCLLLLVCVLLTGLAVAQAPQQSDVTIRSTTDLVLVPVIVTKDGKHVSGLKKTDFTLLEDGKEQPVAAFDEMVAENRKTKFEKPMPGYFTNVSVPDQQPARLVVILIDLINTSSQKQTHAREGVIRYLAHAGLTQDPIALIAMRGSGLKVIHDFSTDPNVLIASVQKLERQLSQGQTDASRQVDLQKDRIGAELDPGFGPPTSPFDVLSETDFAIDQRADAERSELTLAYLNQLTRYLSGLPGRKTLIWATEGIRYAGVNSQMMFGTMGTRSRINDVMANNELQGAGALNDFFPKTWEALAAANIAVYPVDLEDFVVPGFNARSMRSTSTASSGTLKGQTMNAFPENTGGKYCELQENIENCYKAAIDDSSEYYLLAFYPRRKDSSGTHKIQVKVATQGAKVRARTSYASLNASDLKRGTQFDIMTSLRSPLESTAIPLAVRWVPAKNAGKTSAFELRVATMGITFDGAQQNHFHLTVLGTTADGAGKFSTHFQTSVEKTLSAEELTRLQSAGLLGIPGQIEVPAGTESVRFLVRDEVSGRIGTVNARLTNPQ